MKTFFTLFMLVAIIFIGDIRAQQPSKTKVPTKQAAQNPLLQMSRCKPTSTFKWIPETIPFKSYQETGNRDWKKSVGDGVTLYGFVNTADNWIEESYGIYKFSAQRNFDTENLFKVDFQCVRAVYAKGKYYVFRVDESWGMIWNISCYVYDAKTWELIDSFDNPNEWTNVSCSSSIAYDATTDQVYGVTYNETVSGFYLSRMNLENGTFTRICDLNKGYITLAVTNDGLLYGIDDKGVLYQINKTDGSETSIGHTGLYPQYVQSMTCDPTTGKIYWAFFNENEATLYEVNPKTASVYKIDDMPHSEEVSGMYILSAEVPEQAPAVVKDLKFTPLAEGGLTGTISCIAPTVNNEGSNLTGNVKVTIYTGNEKLVEQEVAPGTIVQKESHTFAADELVTLYAIASNDKGESAKQSITVFVGKDNAAAPTCAALTVDGRQATLTWEAPQRGLSDGYINPNEVSYKIIRYAGDSDGITVATTKTGTTTYTETLPRATAKYSYAIISMIGNQEGGYTKTNSVLVVGAYELPFYDNFQDGEQTNQLYTFIDVDNDGEGDGTSVLNKWFWKEDEKLIQYCADGMHEGNDWLITPAIHLDAQNIYNLTFNVNMGNVSNMKVTIGTSTNPSDHKEVLDLNGMEDGWKTSYTTTVKVLNDADYYVGFYQYSGLESWYFNLFDISLEAGISALVPDVVSNLQVIPADQGMLQTAISFDTPETLVNEAPLPEENLKAIVYRNDEKIQEMPVSKGQKNVTWIDENPENGENTYRILIAIGDVEGLDEQRTVWVGTDISEPVKNPIVKTIDGNMHVLLTWEAPGKGVHDGYFNLDDITYSIYRSNNNEGFTLLTDGLNALTYTDTDVEKQVKEEQDTYYYVVVADNQAGQSEGTAKLVVVGTPYQAPVTESFPNGQFNIYPWTIEAIEGGFSFECMHNDKDAGVYPQDGDNGFTKFYNQWSSTEVDSRLKAPVVNLRGLKNPSFSFFMYHWNAEDFAGYDQTTYIIVEASLDGKEYTTLCEPINAAYEREGWVEHRISLADYKDAEVLHLALRGYADNNWMYYYIDNIRIEEQEDYDLAISSFYGSKKIKMNEAGQYTVQYFNRGVKAVSGYTIEFYQDDVLVETKEGETINPGAIVEIDFETVLNAAKIEDGSVFYAKINCAADGNQENNQSAEVKTLVEGTWYPTAENLVGTIEGNDVKLSWDVPEISTVITETHDSMEDYEPFAIDNIGDWIVFDADQHGSGIYTNFPEFPNNSGNKAFQVWNPSSIGLNAEEYPHVQPRTGEQCLVAWYANTSYDFDDPYNDDYLISPEVLGGTGISFYIRRISKEEKAEYYQILYSVTDQDPESFELLQEGEAPADWEEVKATLPEDARYFAIRYIGQLQIGILIDDISYTSAIFALKVEGFNVFRDGFKINEAPANQPQYTDADTKEGRHLYQVSVIYNRGESDASEGIYPLQSGLKEATDGINVYSEHQTIVIETDKNVTVNIYSVDGLQIVSENIVGTRCFSMEKGTYIVRAGEHVTKMILK